MSKKVDDIISVIEKMTVLELNELTKTFQKKFEIESIGLASNNIISEGKEDIKETKKEEKIIFTVILSEIGKNKISVIKEIRNITGLGLKESKDLVESVPSEIKKDIKKELAEEIKNKLEAVGAKVELK